MTDTPPDLRAALTTYRKGHDASVTTERCICAACEDADRYLALAITERAALEAFIPTLHPDGIPCICVAAILDFLDGGIAAATGTKHWDTNATLAALAHTEPVSPEPKP